MYISSFYVSFRSLRFEFPSSKTKFINSTENIEFVCVLFEINNNIVVIQELLSASVTKYILVKEAEKVKLSSNDNKHRTMTIGQMYSFDR